MALPSTSSGLCPKCRTGCEEGATECGRCGIIFAAYRPPTSQPPVTSAARGPSSRGWLEIAKAWLIEPDTATDSWTFYGRAAVFAGLVWWGWTFIVTPLESNYAGESFLHLVNLPFHEAGHVIFMPFGRLMMFLGGSLGQILMPIICLVTFLVKTRDPFAASVALWWTGENFMDVAPYINDARTLDLVLLGGVTGKETDGHDWEQILSLLGWLPYDHRLAHLAHNAGILLMFASFAWAGLLLLRHFRRREV